MHNSNPNDSEQDLEQMLFDGLNEHGFLFQEKCAEVLRQKAHLTKWQVLTTEYPVSINNRDSRVDIILQDESRKDIQIYAIVECKRVSPARGYWLFGKPSAIVFSEPLLINLQAGISNSGDYFIHYDQKRRSFDESRTYLIDNWWLEISKKGSKGKYSSSPNPVEDALTQACIGVSGVAEEQRTQWRRNPDDKFFALFIPVVITTAPLYVAMYDLGDVDLVSGSINKNKVYFAEPGQAPEKIEWLLVDYGIGRSISPEELWEHIQGVSPDVLEEYHKRSIFVVNSQHVVKFFARLHHVLH